MSTIPPVQNLPLARLSARKFNPNKMSRAEYRLLVRAIDKMGFLQPLLVRPHPSEAERFEVVDGTHRFKAAKELGFTEVPCVRRDETDDASAAALQIGMNKNRGAIDIGAAGTAITELADEGWSLAELSITGFSEEEISDLLKATNASVADVLGNADVPDPDPPTEPASPAAHVLEVSFDTREELQRAKRAMRRAAGTNGTLAHGLLRIIDGE